MPFYGLHVQHPVGYFTFGPVRQIPLNQNPFAQVVKIVLKALRINELAAGNRESIRNIGVEQVNIDGTADVNFFKEASQGKKPA